MQPPTTQLSPMAKLDDILHRIRLLADNLRAVEIAITGQTNEVPDTALTVPVGMLEDLAEDALATFAELEVTA